MPIQAIILFSCYTSNRWQIQYKIVYILTGSMSPLGNFFAATIYTSVHVCTCIYTCLPLPSNQSCYRLTMVTGWVELR